MWSGFETLVCDRRKPQERGKAGRDLIERGSNLSKEPHLALLLHCLSGLRKATKLRKEEKKAGLCFEGLISHRLFSSKLKFRLFLSVRVLIKSTTARSGKSFC